MFPVKTGFGKKQSKTPFSFQAVNLLKMNEQLRMTPAAAPVK
ncbi:hypothetical protein [Paenibacillus sp. FJAT-26967]|nr:hypothetical protein [Paenibacillus sp. FJAT-26967]